MSSLDTQLQEAWCHDRTQETSSAASTKKVVLGERLEFALEMTSAQDHGMLLSLLFRLGDGHLPFVGKGINYEAATVAGLNVKGVKHHV